MRILVTGGLGFIGSALVRFLIEQTPHDVLNLDCMTYAADGSTVESISQHARYQHAKVDIADRAEVTRHVDRFVPDAVVHLAAESHVDRSISDPATFLRTNVVGTYVMLEAARVANEQVRFVHVSTDEVFGSLGLDDPPFTADTSYSPRSPYSATKAASDHLVRAWHETYELDSIVTNCSNNYGPYQFPEKLIPLVIGNALAAKAIPIYGDGSNVRDWIHVRDHVAGIYAALCRGESGSTYVFGGSSERTNLEVVAAICTSLDEVLPSPEGSYSRLVEFVPDRAGHDFRYAIDSTVTSRSLGWHPAISFETGIDQTVEWYVKNESWATSMRVRLKESV